MREGVAGAVANLGNIFERGVFDRWGVVGIVIRGIFLQGFQVIAKELKRWGVLNETWRYSSRG